MNGHLYFEIHADDPDRACLCAARRQAAAFYHDVFGWKFTKDDHNPIEYWRIETGGTAGLPAAAAAQAGGLLKRPANTPPPECGVNAFVSSVEVEDFDDTAQAIERLGGQVALPKFAVPGLPVPARQTGVCWQGYFVDPEGNTFGVFQVDEKAP